MTDTSQAEMLNSAADASLKTLHAIHKTAETVQTLRTAAANMAARRTEYREDEEYRDAIGDIYSAMTLDLLETASHMTIIMRDTWTQLLPSKKPSKPKKVADAAA